MKNYWKIGFILSSIVFLLILYRVVQPIHEYTTKLYNSKELNEIPKLVSPKKGETSLTKDIALSKDIKVDFPWGLVEQKDKVLSFDNGIKAWITKQPDYSHLNPYSKYSKSEAEFVMKVLNTLPMKPSLLSSLSQSKISVNIDFMNFKKILVHHSTDCYQFNDTEFTGYFCKHTSENSPNKFVTYLHVFSKNSLEASVMLIDGNEGESKVALDAVRSIIGSLRLVS